jgi:hypothetical protein
MHDFKVLLVLRGGAAGQLIDPLAHVLGILYRLKVIEGCEEVIVPRLLGGGNKGSHGKYVDQLVVELWLVRALAARSPSSPQTGCGGRLRVMAIVL